MAIETSAVTKAACAGEAGQPALRRAASELVNQVFYGTMLRELRESQDNPVFGNGPGGMTFVRQMDVELIKRMSAKGESPLVGAIVQRLTGGGESANPMIALDRAGQETRRQITQSLAQQARQVK